MKKITAFLLIAVLCIAALAGCGKSGDSNTSGGDAAGYSGSMENLAKDIYKVHAPIDFSLESIPVNTDDKDDLFYNAGLSSAENVTDVIRSESMMCSQAYSLVLAKVKSADAAPAVAKEMYDNIDTRKWVCVEADTKIAAYAGDTVMFFMINSEFADQATTDTMLEAFEKVLGGKAVIVK